MSVRPVSIRVALDCECPPFERHGEPAEGREVGRDRDLAQFALLHEVPLVRLDVGLGEDEPARRARGAGGVVPLELVERPAVRPGRLGALLAEVLRDERVEPGRELGDRQAQRGRGVGHFSRE